MDNGRIWFSINHLWFEPVQAMASHAYTLYTYISQQCLITSLYWSK